MITKTLRTVQGKVKVRIPTELTEITIGQMIAANSFDESSDQAHPLIPELTKEIGDNILDAEDSFDIRERMLSLAHKIQYCYNGAALPEFVYFGQKKIRVIKNLSIAPAGAMLASQNVIADEMNKHMKRFGEGEAVNKEKSFTPSLDAMALVLAHYFYVPVTGNLWKEQEAEAFVTEVFKLPLGTALPIARHFFFNYPNLSKQRIKLWDLFKQKLNEKRALRRLRRSRSTTR